MRHPLLLLLASLVVAGAASAQDSASPIQSGSRIRLVVVDTAPATGDLHFTYPQGTVVRFDERSLVVRPDSVVGARISAADTLRVPLSNIGTVETFAGRKGHALIGAAVGLVGGAGIGYVVGYPTYGGSPYCYRDAYNIVCYGHSAIHPGSRARMAVGLGSAGALAGAVVGHFIRTERWTQIDVGSLRLQASLR